MYIYHVLINALSAHMIHIKPMFCDANAVILKMGIVWEDNQVGTERKCVCVLAYSESSGLLLAVCNLSLIHI